MIPTTASEMLKLPAMPNAAGPSEDFLASAADLVGVLAHIADSSRRHSSQHRRDRQLVQTALLNLLPQFPSADCLPAPPPVRAEAKPAPTPQETAVGKAGGIRVRRGLAKPAEEFSQIRRRPYCQCGRCKWCLDNARWEQIFNEKFADPTYYGPLAVRHNSTLAAVR